MNSSKPYLIRAMYDWIVDNNLTPYLVTDIAAPGVVAPEKFAVDGRIVLNISADATSKLIMNNNAVEFDARFSGVIWHIVAPITAVMAIYAKENGRGMVFDGEEEGGGGQPPSSQPPTNTPTPPPKSGRPQLKIVK